MAATPPMSSWASYTTGACRSGGVVRVVGLLIRRVTTQTVLVGPLHQFVIAVRPVPVRIVTVDTQCLTRLKTSAQEECSGLVAETLGTSVSPAAGIGRVVQFGVNHYGNVIIEVILGGIEPGGNRRLGPMALPAHHQLFK